MPFRVLLAQTAWRNPAARSGQRAGEATLIVMSVPPIRALSDGMIALPSAGPLGLGES